jgi:hypothetical protein
MNFFSWLGLNRQGKKSKKNDFEIAEELGSLAEVFLFPLDVAGLDGPKWALKEAPFMAGYLQGYADVLAQSFGRESGSSLGKNIALQFCRTLLKGSPNSFVNTFVEFSMNADGPDFDDGLERGARDGNALQMKKTAMAIALGEHLKIN